MAGGFVHHTPDDERQGDEAGVSIGATVAAMQVAGLPVDIELWPSTADCSQCHQGCHDSPRTA